MSALAKKMMEKYGWKEGEGLGKERTGMKSYVKVVRRDPNVATGLGHAADPAQGGSLASTHAAELDALYGQLHTTTTKRRKKEAHESDTSSSSSSSSDSEDAPSRGQSSDSGEEAEVAVAKATQKPRQQLLRHRRSAPGADSSNSSGSSDADESDSGEKQPPQKRRKGETSGDVTRMTDADLFQRCGGVRLGRAGRHRYFDGKLKRIHDAD